MSSSPSNENKVEQEKLYEEWKAAAPHRKEACLKATNQLRELLNTDVKPDEKLQQAIRIIHDNLNLYHLAVYSVQDDWLVIYAGAGEAIERMLARGEKRKIKPKYGIVGHVGATREMHHAWDLSPEDPIYFVGPDLNATKSEITFPLIAGEKLIGVLNLQSTIRCDFREEEDDAFQNLANEFTNILAMKI
ncbi:MAG: GAF domain-containing protein [Anaerolineales bacterium]